MTWDKHHLLFLPLTREIEYNSLLFQSLPWKEYNFIITLPFSTFTGAVTSSGNYNTLNPGLEFLCILRCVSHNPRHGKYWEMCSILLAYFEFPCFLLLFPSFFLLENQVLSSVRELVGDNCCIYASKPAQ